MLTHRRSDLTRCALALAVAFGVAAGTIAVPAGAAAQSFRPFDEGRRDRNFAAFRRALIRIVDARDLAALQRHFHKDIRMGFGGQNGALVVRRWQGE